MKLINGIKIGQYELDPDTLLEEIKERCLEQGMNYVGFPKEIEKFGLTDELFVKWARFFKENRIYFMLSLSPKEKKCPLRRETLLQMKEIAGEYYLGNQLAELGTFFACRGDEYNDVREMNFADMQEAKDGYIAYVKELVERFDLPEEIPYTINEATNMLPYGVEAGIGFPELETPCADPEIMLPMLRGTARMLGTDFFMAYIAHEWYGGVKNKDTLKKKRLRTLYDFAYMSGVGGMVLESGDLCLVSHGMERGYYHQVCRNYRRVLAEFAAFANTDRRPAGGPLVKVAFVQGNLDGFSFWNAGSSLWNQFSKPEWGYETPEFSWHILEDLSVRKKWYEAAGSERLDLSGAPAYGTYDIINATASSEVMAHYDYLIFTGWNTMTEEIYEKLKTFVSAGGKLLMGAAHLNTNASRDRQMKLIRGGEVQDLFGCRLGSGDLEPVVEYRLGAGRAVLMTSPEYPGAGANYPLYRSLVREFLAESHRECPVKVYGGDKLRFTVYEDESIYLLNTDFDVRIRAVVESRGRQLEMILEPCELKHLE